MTCSFKQLSLLLDFVGAIEPRLVFKLKIVFGENRFRYFLYRKLEKCLLTIVTKYLNTRCISDKPYMFCKTVGVFDY